MPQWRSLRQAAGGGGERRLVDHLDRVDDHGCGLDLVDQVQDLRQVRQGGHLHGAAVETESACPQTDLVGGFLAADVEGFVAGRAEAHRDLKHQGAFADAGIPRQQDTAGWHQSAAQDTVELVKATAQSCDFGRRNVCKGDRKRFFIAQAGPADFDAANDGLFDERVPLAAGHALAGPLGADGAALLADELTFLFGHCGNILSRRIWPAKDWNRLAAGPARGDANPLSGLHKKQKPARDASPSWLLLPANRLSLDGQSGRRDYWPNSCWTRAAISTLPPPRPRTAIRT